MDNTDQADVPAANHQAAIDHRKSVAGADLRDAQVATPQIRQEVAAEDAEAATQQIRRGLRM